MPAKFGVKAVGGVPGTYAGDPLAVGRGKHERPVAFGQPRPASPIESDQSLERSRRAEVTQREVQNSTLGFMIRAGSRAERIARWAASSTGLL